MSVDCPLNGSCVFSGSSYEDAVPCQEVCEHCRLGAAQIDRLAGTRLGHRCRSVLRQMKADHRIAATVDGCCPQVQHRTYQALRRLEGAGLACRINRLDDQSDRCRLHWQVTALGEALAEVLDRIGWDTPIRWPQHFESLREQLLLPKHELMELAREQARRRGAVESVVAGLRGLATTLQT